MPPSEQPVDEGPVGFTVWIKLDRLEDGSIATHRVTLLPRFLRILDKPLVSGHRRNTEATVKRFTRRLEAPDLALESQACLCKI